MGQINLNLTQTQINNQTSQGVMNSAELNAMLSEGASLTPDALMSYCQTRLSGIDTQVQAAFAKQQQANADSSVLSGLMSHLQTPSIALDFKDQNPHDELGKMTSTQYASAQVEAMRDAAKNVSDPSVKQALTAAADALQKTIDSQGSLDTSSFKTATSEAVSKIQQDLNSGAELSMINLQSLMSQRQSAVQTCTNLVQSLGDQMNKIAANIGH